MVELFPCFNYLAILIRQFAIFSNESWNKLLIPHNITFFKDEKGHKSGTCHSKYCTLLPPISQLKALICFKNLFQTLL